MTEKKPVVNIADLPSMKMGHGDAFGATLSRIGPLIGAKDLGCMLTIVEPGKCAFPFHAHHVAEELFFVLEGTGEYRFGKDRYPIKSGDVLTAPAGNGDVAHQIKKIGDRELRYLAISTMPDPDVVEYPDSKKFAVFSRSVDGSPMKAEVMYIGRQEASLDYWDGEGNDT